MEQSKSNHPLYSTWRQMKRRCSDVKFKDYPHYGGRGIRVCDAWLNDFWSFASYMGPRPEGRTLDRIDNDGNYEPGNVGWGTKAQQNANKRPYGKGYTKVGKKFKAQIRIDKTIKTLGYFDCPLMAHLAYRDAHDEKFAAA